jgi:hypothetical protein
LELPAHFEIPQTQTNKLKTLFLLLATFGSRIETCYILKTYTRQRFCYKPTYQATIFLGYTK